MKLDILHVDQLRSRMISQRLTVPGVFPGITRDFVCASHPTRGQHDGFSPKDFEPAAFTIVPERAGTPFPVFQQSHDRVLHVHIDPLMDPVILQRPNHFESSPIPDMSESRISMPSKVPLQNSSVRG